MKATLSQPAPAEVFFKGRPDDPRLGDWVKSSEPNQAVQSDRKGFVLFGYPDDLGVRLNKGRAGAKDGPNSIRKHLYKMARPEGWGGIELLDWGNIEITDDIVENHARAEKLAKLASEKGFTGIFLGGGHDYAAPSFLGATSGTAAGAKWGLINIDPHLDVRPWENKLPHSGTPFRTILESGKLAGENFVEFGARTSRNSSAHWKYCQEKQVQIDTWETIRVNEKRPAELFGHRLWQLATKTQRIGVTFDMDACFETEGVSAPAVVGFSAWEMIEMAGVAGRCAEVRYIEVAEVAPALEGAERSSRIAAEIIHAFLSARG